jgi:hypothetical protein
MYRSILAILALLITAGLPESSIAQSASGAQPQYWYVEFITIDQLKTQNMVSAWMRTSQFQEQRKKNGEISNWHGFIHHTGGEQNIMTLTKYTSWDAINDMPSRMASFESAFPDSTERAEIIDEMNTGIGPASHEDVIYVEGAGSKLSASGASEKDTYWYASFYEVPWVRVDSLVKLWDLTARVTDEAISNGSILGRLRLIHHTGSQAANVVELQQFFSWEAMELRSFGGAQRTVIPDSTTRAAINSGYSYIFDGVPHYDTIYVEPGSSWTPLLGQ